jgi:hypothetical protein
MNRLVVSVLIASGVGACAALPHIGHAQTVQTGTVERVWEDGFRLNTGDRTFKVDTWDLYGDRTPSYVSIGDDLTVTGEFEGGEFDAFTITDNAATPPASTPAASPDAPSGPNAYMGTVEQVWEDGFRLNTGDRTFKVDTWDLYGDRTPSYVSVGDRLTLTGEFENGELDAFTIRPTP